MRRLRAIVADPDPTSRRLICALLEERLGVHVLAECDTAEETRRQIERHCPDLLISETELEDRSGLELLCDLAPGAVEWVIFVSESPEHGREAFDAQALDFLVKPLDEDRLEKALENARRMLRERDALRMMRWFRTLLEEEGLEQARPRGPESSETSRDSPRAAEPRAEESPETKAEAEGAAPGHARGAEAERALRRITIHRSRGVLFLDPVEIDWAEAMGAYVRLHVGEQAYVHRTSMKELEALLDPDHFFRLHRSYIVRLDLIREVRASKETGRAYEVVLRDGTKLALSRRRRSELLARLADLG